MRQIYIELEELKRDGHRVEVAPVLLYVNNCTLMVEKHCSVGLGRVKWRSLCLPVDGFWEIKTRRAGLSVADDDRLFTGNVCLLLRNF